MSDFQWTFGPVVFQADDTPEKFTAKCLSGRFVCRGYIGGKCVWNRDSAGAGAAQIPNTNETPDWCQYKADALRDAQEMASQ